MRIFKREILTFLMFMCITITLIGCSPKTQSESTYLESVNISEVENNDYFKTTPKEELVDSIFKVVNPEKEEEYIVLYQMNINTESVSWKIENEVLQISVNTIKDVPSSLAYKIVKSKQSDFNTISVIKDGEEIPFTQHIS